MGSLKEKGIALTYDQAACALLAEKSIHGRSGARDLRNNIRRMVEDRIASILVERGEGAIAGVAVTAKDGELVWRRCKARKPREKALSPGNRAGALLLSEKKPGKTLDARGEPWYNNPRRKMRRCSSVVEPQPSKLVVWVRFPSPAPRDSLRRRPP